MQQQTPNDPAALALTALAAALTDERRAQRFLALTGIGTDELRERAPEPQFLAAFLAFLEAHEPDLVAVAKQAGTSPEALVEARRALEA